MARTLTALSGNSRLTINLQGQKARDLSTPTDALSYTSALGFTFGRGANQVDMKWADQRELGVGLSEVIDLAGSPGLNNDAFGDFLNLESVKLLVIENTSLAYAEGDATSIIWVGGAIIFDGVETSYDYYYTGSCELPIFPGETKLLASRVDALGYPCYDEFRDRLVVRNASASAEAQYKIIIAGNVLL